MLYILSIVFISPQNSLFVYLLSFESKKKREEIHAHTSTYALLLLLSPSVGFQYIEFLLFIEYIEQLFVSFSGLE